MFSSLLRPKRPNARTNPSPSPYHDDVSPMAQRQPQVAPDYFQQPSDNRTTHNGAFNNADNSEEDDEDQDDGQNEDHDDVESEDYGEDGHEESTPLLPIFSAAHLDAIPLYNLTHSIRLLIIQRCETTLSWDQIRSPQISQFLVKPIQQQIQAQHFNRATLYALLANSLQFVKEGDNTPGNAGVLRTRGLVSELIAMRLLKEYSTRELIDCLAYDFNPMNGMMPNINLVRPTKRVTYESVQRQVASRTSTLEVAIRAQAKRFLAHPLVVQHLEAVWAGNTVFHSAADSLHRYPAKPLLNKARHYGATHNVDSASRHAQDALQRTQGEIIRRSVTLYNPGDASLFKLSRLRVPRYRQVFSTLSYAVMLGLFLATLIARPIDITTMEVIFWLWSAGFMLDEIVGFSEQGFGLYIVSVWNAFDIGILLLFFVYYVLRLYGIIIAETHKRRIANMAYDVLASTAILLFPRLFSVLDHYRYFSQLLIAFRMMAIDLVAILVLLIISCSGFFVAFSLSFGDNALGGPSGVIYALFQIVLGFTPAAWVVWDQYNWLGKALLAMFLIICHFLIVTILITVLTNSFMKIVQNANEEHQYLFAVNTISMVKSDALFTYIAPSNILGWIFSPARYLVPFRQFVHINRTIIKITHFPILFSIFAYERLMLGHYAWEPIDLMEQRGRRKSRLPGFALGNGQGPFSPGVRLREPSVTTFYKDRALEEVFRRPYNGQDSTIRKTQPSADCQSNIVDRWMNEVGHEGGASSPFEQPRSILEQLEDKRPFFRRAMTLQNPGTKRRALSNASRSVLSNPELRKSRNARRRPQPISEESEVDDGIATTPAEPHTTDADGDDERATTGAEESVDHENDDDSSSHHTSTTPKKPNKENIPSTYKEDDEDDVTTPTTTNPEQVQAPNSVSSQTHNRLLEAIQGNSSRQPSISTGSVKRTHNRQSSTNTILFHPSYNHYETSSASPSRNSKSRPAIGTSTPRDNVPTQRPTSKRTSMLPPNPARQRPGMLNRSAYKSAPNVARFLELSARQGRRAPSMDAIALDLASDIGDNRHVLASIINDDTHFLGPVSGADFAEELRLRSRGNGKRDGGGDGEVRMGRLVLARMNTLEEGFKDILNEVRGWRNEGSRGTSANEEGTSQSGRQLARRANKSRAPGVEGSEGGRTGAGGDTERDDLTPVRQRISTGLRTAPSAPSPLMKTSSRSSL